MKKFSERMKFITPDETIQLKTMSIELRNDIFNYCMDLVDYRYGDSSFGHKIHDEYKEVFKNFFHKVPDIYQMNRMDLYKLVVKLEFYYVYDFLEFMMSEYAIGQTDYTEINKVLTMNNSGYRFIRKKLVAISSKVDIKNIEKADRSMLDNGNIHRALEELSKRENPDYNVAMQRSADAVEAAAKKICKQLFGGNDKAKFGENIKLLSANGFIDEHPAYKETLLKLYGYFSDGGIRHPKDRNYQPDLGDATFMLEICSAFVSMLKTKLSEWPKQ